METLKKAGKTDINKIVEKMGSTCVGGRSNGCTNNRVKFFDREERNNKWKRPEEDYRQHGESRDGDLPGAPRFDGEWGHGWDRECGSGPDRHDKPKISDHDTSAENNVKFEDDLQRSDRMLTDMRIAIKGSDWK